MRSKLLVLLVLPLSSIAMAKDFQFAYSPADLVSTEDFYARLDDAVTEHCRDVIDLRDLRGMQACESNLMKIAVQEIDQPRLSAYVESSKTGDRS